MHGRVVVYSDSSSGSLKNSELQLPGSTAENFKSSFVLGFPKAGTVLINNIVNGIMDFFEIPVINLPETFWSKGIDFNSIQIDYDNTFSSLGYCYSGFRDIWWSMAYNSIVRAAPKIFAVRHPFDMLVSCYFSQKYSHNFPKFRTQLFEDFVFRLKNESIRMDLDHYVIANAKVYLELYYKFKPLLNLDTTKIICYERLIYNKKDVVSEIAQWLNLSLPPEVISEIAAKYHVMPEGEDVFDHVRQACPYDFKRKLSPETIQLLTVLLRDVTSYFGYGPEELSLAGN